MSYHERSSRLQLTNREVEIVRQLAEGKTSTEIGATLFISEQTVKFHLTSIYRKLGAGNVGPITLACRHTTHDAPALSNPDRWWCGLCAEFVARKGAR